MNNIKYSIKDLLLKQKEEFFQFRKLKYIPRIQEKILRDYLGSPLVKIVMGPRRAGKSRLIQKVLEDQEVVYINFEEEWSNVSGQELIDIAHDIYPKAKFWYLDEIQEFANWEVLINKLHRRNYNLVITGSNAKLLSSEFASVLTGRHLAIELLPFSYSEFLLAYNKEPIWETFDSYLQQGGFPELTSGNSDLNKPYLSNLFDSIVLKDIVERKKIRNPSYLANCLAVVVDNITARTSARAISKALNNLPTANTVEKYVQYAQEAYLIETIGAYADKPKQRIQSERKPYFIDTGFITAKTVQPLPLHGRKLENSIYLALRRKGYKPKQDIFYYRSAEGYEIDFLLISGSKVTELIQVCLNLDSIETKDREIRALEKASKSFPEATLSIVTANERGAVSVNDKMEIKIIPSYDFCL